MKKTNLLPLRLHDPGSRRKIVGIMVLSYFIWAVTYLWIVQPSLKETPISLVTVFSALFFLLIFPLAFAIPMFSVKDIYFDLTQKAVVSVSPYLPFSGSAVVGQPQKIEIRKETWFIPRFYGVGSTPKTKYLVIVYCQNRLRVETVGTAFSNLTEAQELAQIIHQETRVPIEQL